MIRIVVRVDDAAMFVNTGGGAVHTRYRTFDIDAPDLEKSLRESVGYVQANLVGFELLDGLTPAAG